MAAPAVMMGREHRIVSRFSRIISAKLLSLLKSGESALKECDNVSIDNCYFNLRYPLWHVNKFQMLNSEMTEKCRAAIWYSNDMIIKNCKLNGIKAVRECSNIEIIDSSIESFEFGWKSNKIDLENASIIGEYLFFDSSDIKFNNVNLKGKYSFQYACLYF